MRRKRISGPVVSIVVLLAVSGVFLGLYAYSEHQGFAEEQHRIARRSASGAGENISMLVSGLKTSLAFFVGGNEDTLARLARDPEDLEAYERIDAMLRRYYPDYYAFTLADDSGEVIYDDLGERVGETCRMDIRAFSHSRHPVDIYVHPGPGEHHIDLMLPWTFAGQDRIVFFSFKVGAIARLLHNAEVSGHRLMLLRRDHADLIEVTANGSRGPDLDAFRLTGEQRARILSTVPVADTQWVLVDLARAGLFAGRDASLAREVGAVVALFLVIGGLMIWRVSREERARHAAEEALVASHERLEARVRERTAELSQTNRRLQDEVSRRRKLFRAVEQTDDIVVITDLDGITEYVNPAFEKKTGYRAEEVLGRSQSIVMSGEHDDGFFRRMWACLNRGQVFRETFVNRRSDGSLYHEEKTIAPIRDDSGAVTHFVATGKDISERVAAQKHIERLAYHDALTGLPNRLLLMDRLEHAISHAQREEKILAVLFLDLDRFKTINDSLGHGVGDRLLKTIAERIRHCARDCDTIARLGGDEFALILEGVNTVSDIMAIGHRIVEAVAEPATVEGHELHTTASIGVAVFPFEDQGVESLLRNADTAMYHIKDRGGNGVELYTADMGAVASRRQNMESRLRGALERDEFQVHYQPRVDLSSGQVSGAEALLRWHSPELGMVSPSEFIPLLEETGQISEVGEWILRQACSEFGALYPGLRLAVNLSSRQFVRPGLAERITAILAETHFEPTQLDIEITESVIVQDPDVAIQILRSLHEAGIHIAVDDFGTGYSSLSYLKRFPIDSLKIDRSFVCNLADDPDDVKLVTAIIAMAHSLQMTVVTEGIETERQLAVVRDLYSEEGQGYLFAMPLPLDEFTDWVDGRGGHRDIA